MARFKFFLAVIALLICAGGIGGAYFYWKKFAEPELGVVRHIEGKPGHEREKPDLGRRHFNEALDLLREGELVSARDRLLYLMTYFPESQTFDEAKRIVGEVNLDLLLSPIPQPGKGEHTVRRGEALVSIARRTGTTIDYIMRANGKTTALIYPDEVLTVFPLDFRVEIEVEGGTVTVFQDDSFFKEYTIVDTNLPPTITAPVSTTVSEKVAWFGDRPINFADDNYLNCSKWIRTGKIGLFIREKDPSRDDDSQNFGVMVAKSDMEELFTILRNGTRVNMVN
ncbi:MAG: LysM peptidoglycan-binding domain-containing protein [Verrucomicrobiota bacterium]